MPASDALPVIVGAAIGAGGAVIAQITSAAFTARRERRQLDWDMDRQEREWKMREDERFISLKQELYADFVFLTHQCWAAAHRTISYGRDHTIKTERPPVPDMSELGKLNSRIQLMAPKHVYLPARECHLTTLGAIEASENDKIPTTAKEEAANSALVAWWKMHHAMRADLHGQDPYFGGMKSGAIPKLTPDPEPAHALAWWRRALEGMNRETDNQTTKA